MYDIVNTTHNLFTNKNGINPKYNNRLFTIISNYGNLSVIIGSIKSNINLSYSSDYTSIIWNDLFKPSRMVVNYSHIKSPYKTCTSPENDTYGKECIDSIYSDVYTELIDNKIITNPIANTVGVYKNGMFTELDSYDRPSVFATYLSGDGRYDHDSLRIKPIYYPQHSYCTESTPCIKTPIVINSSYLIISLYE